MFDKPEEIMMAVLFGLWLALTYFLAMWSGATAQYVLLISGLTAVWSLLSFLLWKTGFAGKLWPLMLGLLTACWWPWLDWFAVRHVAGDTVLVAAPWYASWPFKLMTAAAAAVGGYVWKWRQQQKPKF